MGYGIKVRPNNPQHEVLKLSEKIQRERAARAGWDWTSRKPKKERILLRELKRGNGNGRYYRAAIRYPKPYTLKP